MSFECKATVEEVLKFVEKRIEYDRKLLDKTPIKTDAGTDVTERIDSRLMTYIGVREFIRRGK